jgi:hypothetical protein
MHPSSWTKRYAGVDGLRVMPTGASSAPQPLTTAARPSCAALLDESGTGMVRRELQQLSAVNACQRLPGACTHAASWCKPVPAACSPHVTKAAGEGAEVVCKTGVQLSRGDGPAAVSWLLRWLVCICSGECAAAP